MSKTILTIVGIVIIVFAGVMFFTSNQSSQSDELTGTWYIESETEGIKYSVEYIFKDGRYTSIVKQDNGADPRVDEGTYNILSKHEDNSLVVQKNSETHNKNYEVAIVIIEDSNALLLEGMRMNRTK